MKYKKAIVFDLDDTLIYEINFLNSAFREISKFIDPDNATSIYNYMVLCYKEGKNVFEELLLIYPLILKDELLTIYRNHFPSIELNEGVIEVLNYCKEKSFFLGLISDGRSITQRNKLAAIGIISFFDKIIISEEFGSEKPTLENYKNFFEIEAEEYFYIADNPKKDFISPNRLGWSTVCLKDKGLNIHQQNFDLPPEYLPIKIINSLKELIGIIE
ncbi:HAD family hydrolase [Flavobacterium bomense]|uniref:HAD family hydrolase n=1 Tax=Flavobacterium bomense TaxID=2497483 RepID=A0A432CN87_9FLAO|nr:MULTISPECIES: HAD family hydrolase [Flavobacterium]RTY66252.1 HAD family hydrolase [Flavobacterium sp. LB2P53]RTZ05520.1 HAD family hydrolase [Flavobacterium bomense]